MRQIDDVASSVRVICPGCRLALVGQGLSSDRRYHASGECRSLFDELSGLTLAKRDPEFIHQLAVDAYGGSHTGEETPTITTAFALVGLCLVVERGRTGRDAQLAHIKLARQKTSWPRLMPPVIGSTITVADVLAHSGIEERDAEIRLWADAVWQSWHATHAWIRSVCDAEL